MSSVRAISLVLATLHVVSGVTIEPPEGLDKLPPAMAKMSRVLPFAFEQVHHTWITGPVDPQFIREETMETWSGGEKQVAKRMYTRNPFPRIVRMTVVRSEELVWYEEIKVHEKQRYATFYSINLSLQGVGRAYRKATMKVDPNNPKHTIFEQEGGVMLKGEYPQAFKSSVEHFAAQAFLGICEKSTDSLEASLRAAEAAASQSSSSPLLSSQASQADETSEGVLPPSPVLEESDSDNEKPSGLRGILSSLVYAVCHPHVLLSALLVLRIKHHSEQQQQQQQPSPRASKLSERQPVPLHKVHESVFRLRRGFGAAAAAFVGQSSSI